MSSIDYREDEPSRTRAGRFMNSFGVSRSALESVLPVCLRKYQPTKRKISAYVSDEVTAAARAPYRGTRSRLRPTLTTAVMTQNHGIAAGNPVPVKCWTNTDSTLIREKPGTRINNCTLASANCDP